MTLHGADVSSYQPSFDPPSSDSFLFIKASEGTSYRNPYRLDQANKARAKGLQVGWYHYLHHGNIAAQVDWFLNTSGMEAGDLLVCDWEYPGCTTADKDQFIKGIRSAGHKGGLYCNTSWWTSIDTSGYVGDFYWNAAYQNTKPNLAQRIDFWQYTDSPYDQNHGYFPSLADLKAWAGSGGSSTPDTSSSTGDDDDMAAAEHQEMHRTTDQAIKKADDYQWLALDEDDHISFISYPAKIMSGLLYLEIDDLAEGETVEVYAGAYDVKKQSGANPWTPVRELHPDRIDGVKAGWIHRSIPFLWDLGKPGKGWDYRALRFMIKSTTTKAKIVNARCEAWVVKK